MSLLVTLSQYAESGAVSDFYSVHNILETHSKSRKFTKSGSVSVPVPLAKEICKHFIKIIANYDDVLRTVMAWNLLAYLCDRECNNTAFLLLDELQSTDVLSYAVRAIESHETTPAYQEAEFCYNFLGIFTRADRIRQTMAGETPGLMEAHMKVIRNTFDKSLERPKTGMLNLTMNLVGHNTANTRKFLTCGGLMIFYHVLVSAWKSINAITTTRELHVHEEDTLHALMICLATVVGTTADAGFAHEPTLARDLYVYDVTSLAVITAIQHSLMTLSDQLRIRDASVVLFMNYCHYVRNYRPELLEATLLYSKETFVAGSARRGERVPFAVLLLRSSLDARLLHRKDSILSLLAAYAMLFPAVDKVLGPELRSCASYRRAPVDARVLVDTCAYPECRLNTITCGGGLMKCGRCQAVAYCGKEHQMAHWKEHKKSCVKCKV